MEPMDGAFVTPHRLRVASDAVAWTATRSGGPGGQHANTSETAVTVTIDVERSGLPRSVIERVIGRVGATITASSASSRSQLRNREAAFAVALERLDRAAAPPPRARRRTRPSLGAVEERLSSKRRAGDRKRGRRRPSMDE
jgi:ribosome-associated protein